MHPLSGRRLASVTTLVAHAPLLTVSPTIHLELQVGPVYHLRDMESLVLGVDAAWTPGAPSGLALVAARTGSRPRLLRIARSYAEFASDHQSGTDDWLSTPSIGRRVGLIKILEAVKRCSGCEPNVMALDIPLSPRGTMP